METDNNNRPCMVPGCRRPCTDELETETGAEFLICAEHRARYVCHGCDVVVDYAADYCARCKDEQAQAFFEEDPYDA